MPAEPAQGVLFDDVVDTPGELGYRGPAACKAAGITYRQLDYWARTGLARARRPGGIRLWQPAPLRLP